MRIVLAEDSPRDEEEVRRLVGCFFEERGERVELVSYDDGDALLSAGLAAAGDLYLLDIEMPHVSGLQVAKAIRAHDPDVPICFVTSLGHLALEGYAVDAVGFLIKPLSYPSFKATMQRAVDRMERARSRLVMFKDAKNERFADVRAITYLESLNKRTVVHLTDGMEPFGCSEPLKALEGRLAEVGSFFRVHNAFLVNLAQVETVTATDVVVGGQTLPISKHRKRAFMQALASYVGKHL